MQTATIELPENLDAIFSHLSDHEIGNKLLLSYGLFMATWSNLETVIQAALMKELGLNAKKTVVVTGKMQFNPRLQILISLLKIDDPDNEVNSEVIKILNKTEGYAQRNVLVHGVIIVSDPRRLTFVKFEGGGSVKKSFTLGDFIKHVNGLNNRIIKIQQLLKVSDSDVSMIGDATLELASAK